MDKKNPYTLYFGKEPELMIPRLEETNLIMDTFLSEEPSQLVYMITGVRGAGKTVMMTEMSNRFREHEEWIVIELNPAKDMLLSLAAKLYDHKKLSAIFENAKINLSLFGIGVSIDNSKPISDIETAISRMLEQVKRSKKRVLVTIDEATSTDYMRVFASSFQIFIRQDLPIFLIMTGLYENIESLQNDELLTFLYRAPKMRLKPLNIGMIASNYEMTLLVDKDVARKMAQLTKGYSFAYQVLGYYSFEKGGDYKSALPDFRQQLDEYVYDKIWSELSNKDKLILNEISRSKGGNVTEIKKSLEMKPNEFAPYRNRLMKKGLISGNEHGCVSFTLPLFGDYVLDNYYYTREQK